LAYLYREARYPLLKARSITCRLGALLTEVRSKNWGEIIEVLIYGIERKGKPKLPFSGLLKRAGTRPALN